MVSTTAPYQLFYSRDFNKDCLICDRPLDTENVAAGHFIEYDRESDELISHVFHRTCLDGQLASKPDAQKKCFSCNRKLIKEASPPKVISILSLKKPSPPSSSASNSLLNQVSSIGGVIVASASLWIIFKVVQKILLIVVPVLAKIAFVFIIAPLLIGATVFLTQRMINYLHS
ncbi:MAG: hypothetical protein PVI40_03105 [Chlamydiota bacterium]|jgi:hypothetical protein